MRRSRHDNERVFEVEETNEKRGVTASKESERDIVTLETKLAERKVNVEAVQDRKF